MSRNRLLSLLPVALCLTFAACGGNAATPVADAPAPVLTEDALDTPPPAHDASEDDEADIDDEPFDPAGDDVEELARAALAKAASQGGPVGSGGPVQACILSGRITLPGIDEDVRDCMQSNGKYSVSEFQRACTGLANAMVGTGNGPAKIEYVSTCPTPSQGSCKNMLNRGLDAYYYLRSADNIATVPASCAAAGGTWVPNR